MCSPRNCLRQSCCYCCCMDDTNSDDEDAGSCKMACCLDDDDKNGNKCLAIHHTCLGYIFPRLASKIVDKMDRKPVLLIAGRKVPKNHCSRIQVYVYLTIMAVLTGLWFLVTLLEQVIYHSATSCDDIGLDDNRYHICFDLSTNINWSIVDCQTYQLKNHSTVSILCYTYSITPSAFGIAFSVASFVSTIVSITFYSAIYCSDERCSRRGLVIIQFLFVLALVCCAVSIGVLYTTEERQSLVNYFIDERAPLRGVLYALFGVSLLLGACLPWAPFRGKRTYETVASDQP